MAVALVPVPWSTVEAELAAQPYELQAFTWTREGVPPELRRTLPELAATAGRLDAAQKSTTALVVCFLVLSALLVAKAVFS
ncbi:MAG TPA: hypothetical protein VNM39_13260 [Verrucomicrobiae bacterium]|nr:hypothetical protein [Verrucomicrobiae bacterium]